MESWNPENLNEESRLNFGLPNGELFVATPKNTKLYNYQGSAARYDHIVCEDSSIKFYIFKPSDEYQRAADYILGHEYPKVITPVRPSDVIKRMYESALVDAQSKLLADVALWLSQGETDTR